MPYDGLIKITANGPRWSGKVRFVREHLMDPLRWTTPRRIFTDSMSDLFYEGVTNEMRDQIVAVMIVSCLHPTKGGHIFQTLTKRASEMRRYFKDPGTQERVARAAARIMDDSSWYERVIQRKAGLSHSKLWWGTSVENQAAANDRIPALLETPAAVRFLSCEPLLGPIDLVLRGLPGWDEDWKYDVLAGKEWASPRDDARGASTRIDWVITGAESGPRSRPCDVAWLRSLRDQCQRAGTAFFLKQANAYATTRALYPSKHAARAELVHIGAGKGSRQKAGSLIELPYLDGVQHAAFPVVMT